MNEVPKAIEHNITFISCPEEKSEEETEVLVSEYEGEVVGSEDDGEDVKIGVDNKEDRVLGVHSPLVRDVGAHSGQGPGAGQVF